MKFHGCVPLLALVLPLVCGCGTPTAMGPSGVSPGMLMSDVNYPSARDAQTRFDFKRDDIQILGSVKAQTESLNILMLWSTGDNGYGSLMRAARQAYPQADGVVDLQWDSQFSNLCIPCYIPIPIMFKVISHVEGKAFQFKR